MSWPISLPLPDVGGYQETMPDAVIRSPMDVGPDKVRRRTSAAVRKFKLTYSMTPTQLATLDTFFNTTVEGGALTFTMDNPRTAITETYRFMAPPDINAISGAYYRVNCSFEELP